MNMTSDEMIAVITADKEGKALQFETRTIPPVWKDVIARPVWSFNENRYRVKPEPLEIYVRSVFFTALNDEHLGRWGYEECREGDAYAIKFCEVSK